MKILLEWIDIASCIVNFSTYCKDCHTLLIFIVYMFFVHISYSFDQNYEFSKPYFLITNKQLFFLPVYMFTQMVRVEYIIKLKELDPFQSVNNFCASLNSQFNHLKT